MPALNHQQAADFPQFAQHPIACPSCQKRQLKPRVRTNDFRCQECTSIFKADEIEARARIAHLTTEFSRILRAILDGNAPPDLVAKPGSAPTYQPGPFASLICLIVLVVAGRFLYVLSESLSTGWHWTATVIGGLFALGCVNSLFEKLDGTLARARDVHKAGEDRYNRNVVEINAWREKNPLLASAGDVEEDQTDLEIQSHIENGNEEIAEEYTKLQTAKRYLRFLRDTVGDNFNEAELLFDEYIEDDAEREYAMEVVVELRRLREKEGLDWTKVLEDTL
jgi:ribosomal protein L37AE/L43A